MKHKLFLSVGPFPPQPGLSVPRSRIFLRSHLPTSLLISFHTVCRHSSTTSSPLSTSPPLRSRPLRSRPLRSRPLRSPAPFTTPALFSSDLISLSAYISDPLCYLSLRSPALLTSLPALFSSPLLSLSALPLCSRCPLETVSGHALGRLVLKSRSHRTKSSNRTAAATMPPAIPAVCGRRNPSGATMMYAVHTAVMNIPGSSVT